LGKLNEKIWSTVFGEYSIIKPFDEKFYIENRKSLKNICEGEDKKAYYKFRVRVQGVVRTIQKEVGIELRKS
jgi:hypothetical protein